MDKSPTRDNILYKFDEEYVKEMKREQRLKSFGLADYLPNSLQRKADYTSNLDGLSRNISKSRFEKSTFCDTITLPKMRKGSISELGSNFGVTANPSMSQIGINENPSKLSLITGRSQSTQKTSYALGPQMQQVNGSFLFFDEDKKRLSDLGQYSTSMRKRACPERVTEMFKFDK